MDKEKKMERMLPRIKQTVDAVYEYLIPHPDGCGMAAKDFVAAILAGGANQTDNEGNVFRTIEDIAKGFIAFADALIKQLKEDGTE